MKSTSYIFVAILWMCSMCWSCNDWLTVDPKDSVSEDDMFNSARGYESVLNGLYRNMAESSLYGNFLSFGLINVMSQTYDVSKSKTKSFLQASEYKYNEEEFKNASRLLWETAFNCIANANNLIARLNEAPDEMFNQDLEQKNLMLGEAYAVRAYVHFDLLRLYAPAPVRDDGNKYIPYVDYYPCKFATRLTVDETLEKIIFDLQKARKYFAWDTTAMGESNFSNQWQYPSSGSTANNMFYGYRATRFNFYSATATLARVLWYRDGESYPDPEQLEGTEPSSDRDMAARFANMIKSNNTYRYAQEKEIRASNLEERETVKMTRELVFALWKENHSEEIGSYYESLSMNYNLSDYDGLYRKPGYSGDFRYKYGIYTSPQGGYRLTNRWMSVANLSNEEPIIPMIRLSEIYYILADCQFYKDKNKAVTALYQARMFRGLRTQLNKQMERDEFLKLLIEDARKEFAGEGKLFFLYKQLNEKVIISEGETIELGSKFILPIPDSEFILK